MAGIPCLGLNAELLYPHCGPVSLQIATDDQPETDRLWHAIVGAAGQGNTCGLCKRRCRITPRLLTAAMAASEEAERALAAVLDAQDRCRGHRGGRCG